MIDSIKAFLWKMKLQAEVWFAQLHVNPSDIIRLASFFGVGFLIGLVFRRSFKYFIMLILATVLLLSLLQYFDLITINVAKIASLTGVHVVHDVDAAFSLVLHIAKQYAFEGISGGIGLFLGFKTG